jgi:tetratricopeptide (TPR) repeat protein
MDPQMGKERWERVAEIYAAASQLSGPEQHAEFLAQACGDDPDLKHEVESLLQQPVSCAGPLERVAEDVRSFEAAGSPVSIGRYRIISRVGEGGMGTVYEAEQDQPHRTVAIKVLTLGLSTQEMIRRFEQESEALGRLQHPGIAQIYEAGSIETPLGKQPYFAMEFIRGLSLLDYARSLNTRERLELMIKICEAVEHAHSRGIIHRDLKPGNILVDGSGHPKVLDFGVARIADRDTGITGATDLGELVGTLAYMSPEQVLGDSRSIDARSDFYALGVVLYELLSGRLPYPIGRNIHDTARVIRYDDPAPLGETHRAYRSDLETIVFKALEKDKARRYGSAAELAADLQRYLANEPILARPATAAYQLRKFAIRNKALVGTIAAVMVVLVAGILASSAQAIRANRERDRAAAAEQAARAVNRFLENDLLAQAGASAQATPNTSPDPDLKVRTALDRAAGRIAGKFNGQPAIEASIRTTIGKSYSDLGLFPQAEQQFEQALQLRRKALGNEHLDTVESMRDLAGVEYLRAKYTESEALLGAALNILLRQGRQNDEATLATMNDLAELEAARGKHAKAEELLVKVLDLQRRHLGEENPVTLAAMSNLALEEWNLSQSTKAEALYEHALPIMRRINGNEHPGTLLATNNLGSVYRYLGKYPHAEALLVEVAATRRRVLGPDHRDTLATLNSLGLVYSAEGKYAEARRSVEQALEGRARVLGPDHPETLSSMETMAEIARAEGKLNEAESWLGKALEARVRVSGPEHSNTRIILTSLGGVKLEQRKFAEAESLLSRALKGVGPTGTWKRFYAESMWGASLEGLGRYAEAETHLRTGYNGVLQRKDLIPVENLGVVEQARSWLDHLPRNR